MTETQYAGLIRALVQAYYQRHISLQDYRAQRTKIIREMNRGF